MSGVSQASLGDQAIRHRVREFRAPSGCATCAAGVVAITFFFRLSESRLVGVMSFGQFIEGLHGNVGFKQVLSSQSDLGEQFIECCVSLCESQRELFEMLLMSDRSCGRPSRAGLQSAQFVESAESLVGDEVSSRLQRYQAGLLRSERLETDLTLGLANFQHGVEAERDGHDAGPHGKLRSWFRSFKQEIA